MRQEKPVSPGGRVFITGLRQFEIVYLPESGLIISRIQAAGDPLQTDAELRAGLRGEEKLRRREKR